MLLFVGRRAHADTQKGETGSHVVLALDVRGSDAAKVVDAALTNTVNACLSDTAYQARLQSRCSGQLGFAVMEAFNMSLADGCQTVIEIFQAVSQGDLWATIRVEDTDNQPVRAQITPIGDDQFIGPSSDPQLLPPRPGVLVLVDRVGGVDAPVAFESVSNLRRVATDPALFRKHRDRVYGEPGFAWRALEEHEEDQCEEIARETTRLLLGTGTAI